eukprot:2001900-Prymnesium_polylepis.1
MSRGSPSTHATTSTEACIDRLTVLASCSILICSEARCTLIIALRPPSMAVGIGASSHTFAETLVGRIRGFSDAHDPLVERRCKHLA